MFIKLFKWRLWFLLASTCFLCQCTKVVNSSEPVIKVNKKIENPYSISTAAYLAKAKTTEGGEKQNLLLRAAGRMISEGHWHQGLAILAQTSALTATQLNEKNVLLAQVNILRDRPKTAFIQLSKIANEDTLSLYYQVQLHELLAQAYRATGNPLQSVLQRIKLEPLLAEKSAQMKNQRILWFTLINLPVSDLNTMAAEASPRSELQGWLQLALISQQYRTNSRSLLAALDQWQSQYTEHPANQILPNPLDSIVNKMVPPAKQIALLLPLSGTLSGPGKAIRQGFMAAYKANDPAKNTHLKFYDTAQGEIATLYEKAVNEGADYIVGPLPKAQVATVVGMNHPVPTLVLNDTEIKKEDNTYLFGLSPINEAIQVAIKARSKGYGRALIIAPKNEWGNEISKAFIKQWQKKGGQVIDTYSYADRDDLNKKMQAFLHITDSQAREQQVKALLGQQLETSPSRRQDFDMIFLLAYPSKARQIMPLLKYYYADNIPVYATSTVYSGSVDALKDKDLEGIIFCDIPWVFSHQMGTKNWPEQFNSYNRLYALGMDSYALATQLNQLIVFPADGAQETNGTLYLKPSQQVARVLEWGQFRRGLVHSLG
jgi:outer membrane PBP1 activator LpoA protein